MAGLDAIRERLDGSAIFLDFDGTLAEIVQRPERALAAEGVREALEALAAAARLVAIVTGRPGALVASLLDVRGVEVHGLYGLEAEPPDADAARRVAEASPFVEAEAALVPGAWMEPKGLSLAVHFREAPDPDAAETVLREPLASLAEQFGLQLLTGKRVLEVASGRPSKGGLVERLARARRVTGAAFAGDDVADLDAFDALDRLEAEGVVASRVAVRGAETPALLVERADLVVDGPAGLVAALRGLAA
ncbi:MAG: trehalose-phosphatase [Actinobacteria bacterium]|nr:trehalose-phosphatase [Actinomycetota bacterium]